jgi:hypothetical protein
MIQSSQNPFTFSFPSIWGIAKADFLQRSRSYQFLLTLGVCMYLSYTFVPPPVSSYLTVHLGNYRGFYNMAWISHSVAMMACGFLFFAGFFLVNNSIERDIKTGVGEIIATTQISNYHYLLGKMLSNFLVLMTIIGGAFLMSIFLFFKYAEDPSLHIGQLIAPFIWMAMPGMMFLASLTVLFEAIFAKRRVLMNTTFVLLFFFAINPDFPLHDFISKWIDPFAIQSMMLEIERIAYEQFGVQNETTMSFGYQILGENIKLETFHWEGFEYTLNFILSRLVWFPISFIILLIPFKYFHRFEIRPSTFDLFKKKPKDLVENLEMSIKNNHSFHSIKTLPVVEYSFSFLPLVIAEWKMMLKGTSKWWWLITLGLWIATIFVPLEITHLMILPILWFWQITKISSISIKEIESQTELYIFAAYRPLWRQLLSRIGALVGWLWFLALPLLLRLLMEGNVYGFAGVLSGGIFITMSSLCLGEWLESKKLFEALFSASIYMLLNKAPFIDFVNAITENKGTLTFPIYLTISLMFFILII